MQPGIEDTCKQVSVTLTPADEKALMAPAKTRRRKRIDRSTEGGGIEKSIPTETAHSAATTASPMRPTTPAPSLSTTAVVGGFLAPTAPIVPTAPTAPIAPIARIAPIVTIQAKKLVPAGGASKSSNSPAVTASARILPTKRRVGSAPASTFKKPRLVVPIVGAPPISVPPLSTRNEGGGTRRRKFVERKISIRMKSIASTRKARKLLKSRVDGMPLSSVRKFLLRKGIIKPKASATPEPILRSMLKDYLLLHTAE